MCSLQDLGSVVLDQNLENFRAEDRSKLNARPTCLHLVQRKLLGIAIWLNEHNLILHEQVIDLLISRSFICMDFLGHERWVLWTLV